MSHHLSLAAILMAVWLLFSGHLDPLFLSLGTISVVCAVYIGYRMEVVDQEGHPVRITTRAFAFFPWLFWEVIKSNIDVARVILSPTLSLQPQTFTVTADQKTAVGRVIYANSITLTPGTITIDVNGKKFDVHALTRLSADGVKSGDMNRLVCRMEDSR
ncbi:MAG: Na+/H+ antiporter subunit E [Gammaproteobacteria bacterium]